MSRSTRRLARLWLAVLTLVMAVVPATAVAEPITLKFWGPCPGRLPDA